MKYVVRLISTTEVEIEADSRAEAEESVENAYLEGELDAWDNVYEHYDVEVDEA